MKISILVDHPKSWIYPYASVLVEELRAEGHAVSFIHDQADVSVGECAFFLGCEKLVQSETLAKNKHNLVVHESALPAGKGWSPLTWQILEGKNDIPVTLFEAKESADSGDIYLEDTLHFAGHELNFELKDAQGKKTVEMVHEFIRRYPSVTGRPQAVSGESFYPRRRPADSEVDTTQSLAQQFDLLRVVDNERYPAFFNYLGHRYILKIYKADTAGETE